MKAGVFFIRVWRLLSILGFVISLFSSYISYPDEVAVRFSDVGVAVQYLNREVIFYVAIAIFLVNNTLVRLVSRLFLRLPTDRIPVPNQALWAANRPGLNEVVVNWFNALMAAVNTILALGLLVLSLLNRSDRTVHPADYVWLLPLSTAILSIVLLALPVRLVMKPSADA